MAALHDLQLTSPSPSGTTRPRIVGVLPDVTGIDRVFSYAVPETLASVVELGSIVRIPLGPRRSRGWVVGEDELPPLDGLREIEAFVSFGPTPEILELARFGSWRYAGRLRSFLVAASPDRIVSSIPRSVPGWGLPRPAVPANPLSLQVDDLLPELLAGAPGLLRIPPSASRYAVVRSVLERLSADPSTATGSLIVLVPARRDVDVLAGLLRDGGEDVAVYPIDWARARGGARVIVGTRTAVLAPVERLAGVVVLDAADEAYVEERAPTWQANVLAAKRAATAGVPCLLVSATPTLDLLAGARIGTVPAELERAGWPTVEVLDRRGADPRSGLFADTLAELVRGARQAMAELPVVAVLNRTGRARLLACSNCGELVTCEHCGGALAEQQRDGEAAKQLGCGRCGASRPAVCGHCDSARLKTLRIGVGRAAEEFGALVGEAVAEVTSATTAIDPSFGLFVGSEAVLHRVRRASLVVFLDFDQELLAPRLRASEQALGLIARAGRLVGGRSTKGGYARRIVVQTRLAGHPVLEAARSGDPGVLEAAELPRRVELRLPPTTALAMVSGEDAATLVEELTSARSPVQTADLGGGRYLLRASSSELLADALAGASGTYQVRIEVDPVRA